MKYVVVGAGPAGVIAAETIRKRDKNGSVVLVGDEPEPPYSRMAIPYYLTGKIAEQGTHIRKTAGHYEKLNIERVAGQAASVDPKKKTVALDGGKTLAYDKLLVATGSHPIKPPVPGLDLPNVHHCWTLADARAIHKLAKKGAGVVLMGAGFIGCIILESLLESGVDLTVVEKADRMVPRMMDAEGGLLIKRWCEAKGVKVLTGTGVAKVEKGSKKALKVSLDSGAALDADLLVVAAGVRANADFLKGSGVTVEDGIRVDDRLRTSVDGIYAAGDCAQGPDISGGYSVHAVQPTSADHGRIAGINMTGGDAAYKGSLSMNVLDTAGLVSASFGLWDGVKGGERATALDESAFRYIRLEFSGDKLVGALSLGRTDQIGVVRGLIQTGVALGPWKARLLEDPHRIADAYVACTQ